MFLTSVTNQKFNQPAVKRWFDLRLYIYCNYQTSLTRIIRQYDLFLRINAPYRFQNILKRRVLPVASKEKLTEASINFVDLKWNLLWLFFYSNKTKTSSIFALYGVS